MSILEFYVKSKLNKVIRDYKTDKLKIILKREKAISPRIKKVFNSKNAKEIRKLILKARLTYKTKGK